MIRAVQAGIVYASLAFAAGFAFGTLRSLFVAPAVGEWPAHLIEAPAMMIVCWFAAGMAVRARKVGPSLAARAATGFVFLAALLVAEQTVVGGLRGWGVADFIAYLGTPLGAFGLSLQAVCATFPLFVRR